MTNEEIAEKCKRDAIKEIIELTALIDSSEDESQDIWGMDTVCGDLRSLIDKTFDILAKHKIKITHGLEATQGMWNDEDLKQAFYCGQGTAIRGYHTIDMDKWLTEYKQQRKQ